MQVQSLSSHLDRLGETQANGLVQDEIPTWYHGGISREVAESLLQNKPLGCFLVRVSQSHVGYTLSYRAKDCCRHFMIKPLPNGHLMIPGVKGVYPTLMELVSFYQKTPLEPYKELLTHPCGQKNETDAHYEDISLYSNMAADATPVDSSSTHMPKPCSSPLTVPLKPTPLPQKRMSEMRKDDRPKSSSQPSIKPLEQSPALSHTQRSGKVLLNDAPQKIWKNLKNLPQTGKKITEQIKSHLPDVKLSFPSSAVSGSHVKRQVRGSPGPVGDEFATQVEDSHPEREAQNLPINIYIDPFIPKLNSYPKIQDLCLPPRTSVGTSTTPISTSEEAIFPHPRRRVISGTTCQDSAQPADNRLGPFPSEYHPPPPFAPGY